MSEPTPLPWNESNPEWWRAQVEMRADMGDVLYRWLVNEWAARPQPSGDLTGAAQDLVDHLDRTGVHAPGPTGCVIYDHFDAIRLALRSLPADPAPETSGLRLSMRELAAALKENR